VSENIGHYIDIDTKDEKQADDLCSCLEKLELDTDELSVYGSSVCMQFNAYRGGGHSCEDNLNALFKPVFELFPNLEFTVTCEYLDRCPHEDIELKKGYSHSSGVVV